MARWRAPSGTTRESLYSDKAIVAFSSSTSPAGKAGILPDDEIVELNGLPITRQSEFKHAIGPLYEGDKIDLIVVRDDQKIPFSVELAGEIQPYQRPGIGITLRADEEETLTVERILENSPAAKSGLQVGDTIESWADDEIDDAGQLRSHLVAASIGQEIDVAVQREGNSKQLKMKLEAHSASPFPEKRIDSNHLARITEIKVADAANNCFALIPKTKGAASPALLVWISAPGKLDSKAIQDTWLAHCQRHNVAILIPESTNPKRWSRDDAHFIETAIENLARQSAFDPTRVVVGGRETGGTMASLIAFGRRDLFQGLVLIDAKPSTRITRLETSPVEPLMVFFGAGSVDFLLEKSIKGFEEANFPVHLEEQSVDMPVWIQTLLPWVETVNRL